MAYIRYRCDFQRLKDCTILGKKFFYTTVGMRGVGRVGGIIVPYLIRLSKAKPQHRLAAISKLVALQNPANSPGMQLSRSC